MESRARPRCILRSTRDRSGRSRIRDPGANGKTDHRLAVCGGEFFDFFAEGRVDFVAIVALVGLGVDGRVDGWHLAGAAVGAANQNSAAFGGKGLLAVGVDGIKVLLG